MMKIINEFKRPFHGLTKKQKAIVAYFLVSFCLLSVAEAPMWAVFLIVLNLCNSARLIRKIPPPETN
jgi:hypothetical protein